MLLVEFFEQNLHFAVCLLAALVFFAVFWLYFDAWMAVEKKNKRDITKWAGFLIVSLSFVIYATIIEESNLGHSIFGDLTAIISDSLRLVGYVVIIIGQLLDPLQNRPETSGVEDQIAQAEERPKEAKSEQKVTVRAMLYASSGFGVVYALPLAALAIAGLYWRRATTGLERHLRAVSAAFVLLTVFELLSLAELLRATSNPKLFDLVKAFGPFWITSHLFLFAGVVVLGVWVWRYLTERFLSQLFMIFASAILTVFLITTFCFTYLLLRDIQVDTLNNMATATSVLSYALNGKKAEAQADAEVAATNPSVLHAIETKDNKALQAITTTLFQDEHISDVVITTNEAQVLLRGANPQRWGDSISSDTLIRRALIGETSATIESTDGVLAPVLTIRSIVPVRDNVGQIAGTVAVSMIINSAFMDGIKQATGLDSAVYSGAVRSATTITAPDGVTRWVGIKEANSTVLSSVIKHGQTYKGILSLLNRQYLAVYSPLKDVDNVIIGMLFVGQPAIDILQTTSRAIELTFIMSSILLVLSIIPAYLVARYIAKQLE